MAITNAEAARLKENYSRYKNWLQWGPYLSERQWATVREDYSPDGNAWGYFPHEHARSRTYRWGEDGLAGISDERCRLCFSVALWNGKDDIIKERLFGVTGPEGNHGEDVKELYYYLDSTPTHSYMKHLYKYPQQAFPYAQLLEESLQRSKQDREFEITDTGVFDNNEYFDVYTEYAKADANDILIRIRAYNRSSKPAPITMLPTLWFRNLWSFGQEKKPKMQLISDQKHYAVIKATSEAMEGPYFLYFQHPNRILFTENETNREAVFGEPNLQPLVKDAINDAVINQDFSVLEDVESGTKTSPLYEAVVLPGKYFEVRLRLSAKEFTANPLKEGFENIFAERQKDTDDFFAQFKPSGEADPELINIQRQAFAGLLWTKQYYNINVAQWLKGDPGSPPPNRVKELTRNRKWKTLSNEDIISMPDKWEYPWYAAWDSAFHCVPLAMLDPDFAKGQLLLFLNERYMRPNGQIPAYEWSFGDVNPPVHAWACMKVYRLEKRKEGQGDVDFLKRVFQKLLINFTWWVNSKDRNDNNVFEGGFLGLDNIGPFDRSSNIPGGGFLEQADGTSWMAMYCLNMLDMALEIAQVDSAFEDVATKFLEHFVYIAESLNKISEDWVGAWDEEEGFFYDILVLPDEEAFIPLKIRSLVGLTSFFATLLIEEERLDAVPNFKERMVWLRNYRMQNGLYAVMEEFKEGDDVLLSLLPRQRLIKMLHALLDEKEFLSPWGIRSLSKKHETPYTFSIKGEEFSIAYEPGESTTTMYGGNSNWRGPVWFPMNYILLDALREFDSYYGETLQVEFPADTGQLQTLGTIADKISRMLISIFRKNEAGERPVNDQIDLYRDDPHFQDLILFFEYFHGDNGRGLGASHQTGWTGVIAQLIDEYGWQQ
ncbi:MAG TPA: hypothetical protein VJ953_05885 [Saprospiraceae bacterium]|nr:hypothetical protein [Saprospiraceae bacterium]